MPSRRTKISLQPSVLQWARERARVIRDELARKMQVNVDRVVEWEETGSISVAQVDRLAERTHTPLGLLYLSKPPEDKLPIPDFRTRHVDTSPLRASLDLLETVYTMQRRQDWMRDDLIESGEEPLEFVGAFSRKSSHVEVASAMRDVLRMPIGWAEDISTWMAALRFLRSKLDAAGVLVVFNGVVGNSTSRKLDPDEFQGFALVDDYAPLIFVNNADFISAKMFTLVHELAHVFVGESGVSQFERMQPSQNDTERFCDQAAAEFLVPESSLRDLWNHLDRNTLAHKGVSFESITRQFKVSAIVAARRALDLDLIDLDTFYAFYENHKQQGGTTQPTTDGGNFWNTQRWRIGLRFAGAVARAVKEGRLLYREAYNLTGLREGTFEDMPDKMGIDL